MGVAKNEGCDPTIFYILVKREILSKAFWKKIAENLVFKSQIKLHIEVILPRINH
jgi:hypothetical protein